LAAPSVANRTVHCVLQVLPPYKSGQVQNRASRARARQAIRPTSIDVREMCRRMDRAENSATLIRPKDEHINRPLPEAVKTVKASCRSMAHHSARPSVVQRYPEVEPRGARCSGERQTSATDPLELAAIDPPLDL
jgi:hypothetical protein